MSEGVDSICLFTYEICEVRSKGMMCLSFRIKQVDSKYKKQVERRLKEVISVFSNEMRCGEGRIQSPRMVAKRGCRSEV